MNKCNLLVLCYFHNEDERLSNSIVSVLNQEKIDLNLLLFDNNSDDRSRDIAVEIAKNDSRVTLIQSKIFLSVTDSWFQALRYAFKLFDFDYLVLIGGDDEFANKDVLYQASQKLRKDSSLKGVLPIFSNQFGNKFALNVSRLLVINRFKLVCNWQFVHAMFGVYQREVWSEVLHAFNSLQSKKLDSDWWVSLYLLKFKVVTLDRYQYYKYLKNQSYASHYYNGDKIFQNFTIPSDGSGQLKTKKLLNSLIFAKISHLRFFQELNRTFRHFNSNKFYLRKHFKIEYLIYPIFFFAANFYKIFKSQLYNDYSKSRSAWWTRR